MHFPEKHFRQTRVVDWSNPHHILYPPAIAGRPSIVYKGPMAMAQTLLVQRLHSLDTVQNAFEACVNNLSERMLSSRDDIQQK
jgi:hypothetical protein